MRVRLDRVHRAMTSITPLGVDACAESAFECFDPARAQTMFGSEQSLRKVLQMAFDSLATDVDKIGELLDRGELKQASHLLHGIKGFAPIFCGSALSARIADLERSSKTEPLAQVRNRYGDLKPVLIQWCGEIERHLARTSTAPERAGVQRDCVPHDDSGLKP